MALRKLDPAPTEALVPGWEIVATEAGRSNKGLSATVTLFNGAPQAWQTLMLGDPSAQQGLSTRFAQLVGQEGLTATEVVQALLKLANAVEGVLRQAESKEKAGGESQATLLVNLAAVYGAELFHSPEDEAYATINVEGHRETWPLKTKGFRRWLARLYFVEKDKAPGSQAIQDALTVLEGQACFDGAELPVSPRLAAYEGNIYLDLANERWQAVEVSPTGWRVIDACPVKFRRMPGMLPLPVPQRGGTLVDLRPFLNLAADSDWRLVAHWLLAAFRPRGPYPVLVVHGGHGSAKSTLVRVLRSIVDPNTAPLRLPPRDVQNVAIAASNSWVVAYDNLSHLPDWLSDALCCVSTGLGFATRTLFTDGEESLFQAMRPIAINGIEEVATRADFLDRSLIVHLPPMDPTKMQDEEAFWTAVDTARPQILGAILDIVCQGLATLPTIKLSTMPRMADFAKWSCAVAAACGWTADEFLTAYQDVRENTHMLALEASLLWPPLSELLTTHKSWDGSSTDLLAALCTRVDEDMRRQRDWPKKPNVLANVLRRLQPTLKEVKIAVEFSRDETPERNRKIKIVSSR